MLQDTDFYGKNTFLGGFMLFDIKDLDKKRRAEEGDQEALYELAELYANSKDLEAYRTAFKYYKKVIEKECNCTPSHYVESLNMCAIAEMEKGDYTQALHHISNAKELMEKEVAEQDWNIYVFSNYREIRTIVFYQEKLIKGGQQAILDMAQTYAFGGLSSHDPDFYNDDACRYFTKVIEQQCEIDKNDYLDAYLWLGKYHYSKENHQEALKFLHQGKLFMEQEIEPKQWSIELYELLISSKNQLLNL